MRFLAIVGLLFSLNVHASIINAPDGILIGAQNGNSDRIPLFEFNEFVSDETVVLGEMAAGEIRTLTFNDVPFIRLGETCMARPQNPGSYETLEIRHVWASGANQMKAIIKNDSASPVTYSLNEQWILTYWNTSNP